MIKLSQKIELMAQHSWPNWIAVIPYIVKAHALVALKDGDIAGVYSKEGQNADIEFSLTFVNTKINNAVQHSW